MIEFEWPIKNTRIERNIRVRSHNDIHLDERAALWLVHKFASEQFLQKYCSDGILYLGVEEGPFDDHRSSNNKTEGHEECCTTLVAKALGVLGKPELADIIEEVRRCDTKRGVRPLELASIVKAFNLPFVQGKRQQEQITRFVFFALETKYCEQRHFHQKTAKEYEKRRVEKVKTGLDGGKTLKIVTVESSDPLIQKFCRSPFGDRAAVLIQRWPDTGNVQIFTDMDRQRVYLDDVARMIRQEEREARNSAKEILPWSMLVNPVVPGAGNWYYHKGTLLNGSLSHPNVKPTRLSLNRIQQIVRVGINPSSFHRDFEGDCRRGICASTVANPCPLYIFGLYRCREIRFKSKQREQKLREHRESGEDRNKVHRDGNRHGVRDTRDIRR